MHWALPGESRRARSNTRARSPATPCRPCEQLAQQPLPGHRACPRQSSLPVVDSLPQGGRDAALAQDEMTRAGYPTRSAVPPASDSRGRRPCARAASLCPRAGCPADRPARGRSPRASAARGTAASRELERYRPRHAFLSACRPPSGSVELDRRLSPRRSAPPVRRSRPAVRRGRRRRRRPPAARSSGFPAPRRPARAAAWPPRRPGS